jgi:hypothetical protein
MIVIDKNPVCVFSYEYIEWQRKYEQRSEQRGLGRLGGGNNEKLVGGEQSQLLREYYTVGRH